MDAFVVEAYGGERFVGYEFSSLSGGAVKDMIANHVMGHIPKDKIGQTVERVYESWHVVEGVVQNDHSLARENQSDKHNPPVAGSRNRSGSDSDTKNPRRTRIAYEDSIWE
jgi:hypothetical protein